MSNVQDRINDTLSRADEVLAEQMRRQIERMKAEDAEQARADAAQAKADALKRSEIQEKYDAAFRSFWRARADASRRREAGRFPQEIVRRFAASATRQP